MRFFSLTIVFVLCFGNAMAFSIVNPATLPAAVFSNKLLFALLFPLANLAGFFISPLLQHTIGQNTVEYLDTLADASCIASAHDDSGGGGICQNFLEAVYNFTQQVDPALQAEEYQYILFTFCIAPRVSPPLGTCQALLSTADCVANRLIGTLEPECEELL